MLSRFAFVFVLFSAVLVPSFAFAAGNLVPNGDFEIVSSTSSTTPQGWEGDFWGTLTATFTYPVAGDASTRAAQVTISKYTSGDAKWYFGDVPVTAGTVYQVSDNYMSNVATEVDAEFLLSNGTFSYVQIASPATSNNAWATFTGSVTAPATAVSMSLLHVIFKVGTLTIDNVSVTSDTTPPPPPPPATKPVINSFSANPVTITSGQTSTLSWSVASATTLSIDQGVGAVTGSSKTVSPIATTTYTLTAANSAGTTTATADVNVIIPQTPPPPPPPPAAPTCSLAANPTSILVGSSTTLTFSSTNASSATINNGVGAVATTGTKIVSPAATTLYVGTFAGAGGTTTCSANVTVTTPPPPPPPPSTNLISNGTFEAGSGSTPTGWSGDWWGSLTQKFTYPVAGDGGGKAAQVTVTKYKSGDAKWYFGDVPVSSNTQYLYTDNYISTTATNISIEFLLSNGTYDYEWLGDAPTSTVWATFSGDLTVPRNAVKASILHTLVSNGTLTIDNASLTPITLPTFSQGMVTLSFDDGDETQFKSALPILTAAGFKGTFYIITTEPSSGDKSYMTWPQIKTLGTDGMDIAGHTQTHPYLTQITTTQQQKELSGSYTDLVAQGFSPKTLAYPFGDEDPAVEALTKNAGYSGARGSYFGLNGPYSNRYALYDIRLDPTVSLATAESWIDQALADKRWVIFEIHDVETTKGDGYQITPAFLQSVVNYLKSKNASVVTTAQGMALMNP